MTPAPGGESSLRGQWFIQMGLESLTEEAASKQEFQGWAAIFPDRSGRFGGRWNLLGGDKHLGKAGGQGTGERKKEGACRPHCHSRVVGTLKDQRGCWATGQFTRRLDGKEARRQAGRPGCRNDPRAWPWLERPNGDPILGRGLQHTARPSPGGWLQVLPWRHHEAPHLPDDKLISFRGEQPVGSTSGLHVLLCPMSHSRPRQP